MKRITLFALFPIAMFVSAQKVCLPEGTNISIRIQEEVSSKKFRMPTAVVAGNVFDVDGEKLLIKSGTPVEIQVKARRATLSGDVGKIVFTPISTTAVDGRSITFEENSIEFIGNESIINSRQQVNIKAGTTFIAKTSNFYCFKIE